MLGLGLSLPGVAVRRGGAFPSLDLNFLNGTMPAGPTFTRASAAWAYNSSGVLTSFATNAPRLGHDPVTLLPKGLLVEEARTNLLVRSAEFDNASWVKTTSTVTADAATAPDGTTTADRLVEDGSVTTGHRVGQIAPNPATATAHTFSVHIKAGTRTKALVEFQADAGATATTALVDLGTGAISSFATAGVAGTYAVTAVGGGWYRASVTVTPTGTGSSMVPRVKLHNGTTDTYTGDGASYILVWGAQLELGSFATSYIPTTSASATRAADLCTLALGSWFNASEGVLLAEWLFPAIPGAGLVSSVVLDDATSANAISVRIGQASLGDGVIRAAGVSSMDTAGVTATANAVIRQAVAYATNNGAHALNGTIETDASVTVPGGLTRLLLTGSNVSAYWLRSVRVFNRRLPDATLRVLTA